MRPRRPRRDRIAHSIHHRRRRRRKRRAYFFPLSLVLVHDAARLGFRSECATTPAAARVRRCVHDHPKQAHYCPRSYPLGGGAHPRLSPPVGGGYGCINRPLTECLDPGPVSFPIPFAYISISFSRSKRPLPLPAIASLSCAR